MFSRFRMGFYAVRIGRVPGIYHDWDSCKAQVTGYSGCRYKKFKTASEAQAFINEGKSKVNVSPAGAAGASSSRSFTQSSSRYLKRNVNADNLPNPAVPLGAGNKRNKSTLEQNDYVTRLSKRARSAKSDGSVSDRADDKTVEVYTDGACEGNGKCNPRAGIGVFWGPDHPMNVSERLPGRQTNNRAEIHAAVKAIEQAKQQGYEHVRLHTDSQFLVNAMTKWVNNWLRNGWRLSSGDSVINREDFEEVLQAQKGIKVSWIHCRGHSGIYGNEMADRLAVEGLRKNAPS